MARTASSVRLKGQKSPEDAMPEAVIFGGKRLNATRVLRLAAHAGMLEFQSFREKKSREIEKLAGYYERGGEETHDVSEYTIGLRKARILFADYLLEMLGKMVRYAETNNDPQIYGRIESVRKSISEYFSSRYFFKKSHEIRSGFDVFKTEFEDLAERCGLGDLVLPPPEAVNIRAASLDRRINEMNGLPPEPAPEDAGSPEKKQ